MRVVEFNLEPTLETETDDFVVGWYFIVDVG